MAGQRKRLRSGKGQLSRESRELPVFFRLTPYSGGADSSGLMDIMPRFQAAWMFGPRNSRSLGGRCALPPRLERRTRQISIKILRMKSAQGMAPRQGTLIVE
jgi:hypothetical protein